MFKFITAIVMALTLGLGSVAQGQIFGSPKSRTLEFAIISLLDGSAETQIASTNLGTEKLFSTGGPGRLTKLCIVSSLGSVIAEDGSVIFFDADPSITIDASDMSLAIAQTIVAIVSFVAADYLTSFAASTTNCQTIDEPFHLITHVVYHQQGATTLDDEDIEIHVWWEKDK